MSKMLFFAQNRRMGPPPQFSVQPTSLSFGYSSSSKQLTINSNYPWTYVSGETSWCTIDTKSGDGADTINVSVTENTSTSQTRSATLLFRNEKGLEARVRVSQAVHEAYTISVQPTSVTLQKASGSQASITISANQGWSISGTPAWATLSKSSGTGNDTVTITAASENTSTDERSATLTITGSQSGSATVSLKQNATEVVWSVSPESISIEADDTSDHALTVTSNTSWTITEYPDWVQVSKSSGIGNDTVNVKAKSEYTGDTQRSGTITFKNAKGSTLNVTITQSAATITYSDPVITINYSKPESPDAPADGNEIALVISFTQTWGYNGSTTGGGSIEWATGDDPIGFDIEWFGGAGGWDGDYAYISGDSLGTTLKERTKIADVYCKVTINGKTGTSNTLEVYQEANEIKSLKPTMGYLTEMSGSSDTGWTATFVPGNTIPVNAKGPDTGSTSGEVSVIPALTFILIYTSGANSTTYTPENILNQEVDIPWEGDISWSMINFSDPSIIDTAFQGLAVAPIVTGTLKENGTSSTREGTLTATMSVNIDGKSLSASCEWQIEQAATENYLNVSPQTLSFEANGGTKEITIDTNESWTIS